MLLPGLESCPHSVVSLWPGQVNLHRSLLGKGSDGGGDVVNQQLPRWPSSLAAVLLAATGVCLLCPCCAALLLCCLWPLEKMSATLCHSGPMHSRNSAQGGSEEVTGEGTCGGDAAAAEAAVPVHRDCRVRGGGGGRGQPKWNWVSPMQESSRSPWEKPHDQ